MTGVEYVEEQDLVAAPLRAAVAPLPSLMMAMRDAAGAGRSDTPEAWCRVIRAHLTRRDQAALAPLSTSEPTLVPSALVPFPDGPAQSMQDALEAIVAAEDVLGEEIQECLDADGAGDWREASLDPGRWVRGLVVAMTHAWAGFRPIWDAAQERVACEMRHVGDAGGRGAHLHVLGDLIPYGHVVGDRWMLECDMAGDTRVAVADEGLTLVPLVAGCRASIVDRDASGVRLVGYPLRARAAEPALEALLGIPRARILRALPATNNDLAAVLQAVPSAATHHVSALAAAGLAVRDRSNGSLLVRRTPRGDALLALYER